MAGLRTYFPIWSSESPADLVQPRVTAALAIEPRRIIVSFSEPMKKNAVFLDPTRWSIDDPRILIQTVSPFGDYGARLFLSEMEDGRQYVVTASTLFEDKAGNALDPSFASATFDGLGEPPTLDEVSVLTESRIRLRFSEQMAPTNDLFLTSRYTIAPTGSGAPMSVSRVEVLQTQPNPDTVDLIVTEGTDGEGYEVTVSGLVDAAGNSLGTPSTQPFVAIGVPPVIQALEALGPNRVDVIFNESIRANAFALDPANYVWDNGLVTIEVLNVVDSRVQLVTSDQDPNLLYTLTVTP